MATSLIPGFITRRQAAERCKRSERSLQRYWSDAIEHQDSEVLERLKLRTEDGKIVAGPDVTKDLIDELKKNGRNPTWFVHATWAEKKYGPRLDDTHTIGTPQRIEKKGPEVDTSRNPVDVQVVGLLREQLAKRDDEIGYLREELKIKNEQITEANARTRESNILMQQLQTLLGDVQQRAFPALTGPGARREPQNAVSGDVIPQHNRDEAREGSGASEPSAKVPSTPTHRKKKPSQAAKPQSAVEAGQKNGSNKEKIKTPKWNEFPTLKRLFSRRSR